MSIQDIDLSTKIGGINMDNPLMNASGVMCTEIEDLQLLNSSSCGGFISKSCTLLERRGNPEPRYYSNMLSESNTQSYSLSINSMGIPNHGYQYYIDAHQSIKPEKPYSISISGMSWEENSKLLGIMKDSPVNWVELNVS